MWDSPFLMRRVSNLLFIASAAFLLVMGLRMGIDRGARIERVEVLGAHNPQTLNAIPSLVATMSGGFFSLDLEATRAEFERQPWVRSANVARIWPDRVVVRLEEHIPAAAWNDLSIMSTRGELFPARPWEGMPKVYAPEGMEYEVAAQMGRFSRLLAASGHKLQRLSVDPLGSWSIDLDDGSRIVLGREQISARLARFLRYAPQIRIVASGQGISHADLRYPNGFAVVHSTPKTSTGKKS